MQIGAEKSNERKLSKDSLGLGVLKASLCCIVSRVGWHLVGEEFPIVNLVPSS